jgi:hypothetical protein
MVSNENDNSDSYYDEYILFVQLYAYSFALSVKGVKCTTAITWMNDKILLRDVYMCIEEKNELLNTSNWTNSITHIKQYQKNEIESKMTNHICWLNNRRIFIYTRTHI